MLLMFSEGTGPKLLEVSLRNEDLWKGEKIRIKKRFANASNLIETIRSTKKKKKNGSSPRLEAPSIVKPSWYFRIQYWIEIIKLN